MSDGGAASKTRSSAQLVEKPPTTIGGILLRLGPGLVIAGSIVGSGELIATTATGAKAGFWLLWLILVGCVIKVFVQVEFGRYAITTGVGTLQALDEVPGPRIKGRGNWLVWYWVAMFLASLAQLGGIVGGVGQALAISAPITQNGRLYNEQMQTEAEYRVAVAELALAEKQSDSEERTSRIAELQADIKRLAPIIVETRQEVAVQQRTQLRQRADKGDEGAKANLDLLDKHERALGKRLGQIDQQSGRVFSHVFTGEERTYGQRSGYDDRVWAAVIAIATSIILVMGRYGLIQAFSTAMVAAFTFITIVNLFALQTYERWAVTGQDIVNGLSFQLPPASDAVATGDGMTPLATALFAFGIIGVGASELVAYPYWCLEKGYARWTGPRDTSTSWTDRARGWLRVMRWDCWCSMVVYTFATIAFYLLGAAILHRVGLNPAGTEMIRTLSVMYAPVFGPFTQMLFLFGAFAVLYSTFFVANAGQARMCADAMRVVHLVPKDDDTNRRWITYLSGLFPLVCLVVYIFVPKPKMLVLFSGLMQAVMLPMLAGAGLYFRYKKSDQRITPGKAWDVFLWISAAGMFVAGVWAFWAKITG